MIIQNARILVTAIAERPRARAEDHAVDGEHREGEARVPESVRPLDPGRHGPLQAHDRHRLQLRAGGDSARQLGQCEYRSRYLPK